MRKHVKGNVSWVGYIDWELESFHGDDYSIKNGSSQNAYLIEEEKTVLIDTVWTPHRFDFVENLKKEIDLKKIDFIVANHGECDHSGSLTALMDEIPDTPIYCTANAVKSIEGQYGKRGWDFHVVKTGDTIDIGNGKQLVFVEMRMLHWPDSMATYLTGDNILFSNDAFGQHYAVEELFNDKADQCLLWKEAMKYYANILNPFSMLVSKKLTEIAGFNLPIEMIAPSHGAIWRDNPLQIVEKYGEWATAYQEDQVTVAYDTMWEGTAKIAHAIAEELHRQSPETVVKVFNIAKADKNEVTVDLYDKADALCGGSQMKSASTPPCKDNLRNIPNFYQAQFKRMDNVRIHLGKEITKDNLDELKADAVILATGAVPIVPGIPGLRENRKVVTANEVLTEGAPVTGKVVIAGGGQVGVETAHYLAEKGYKDVSIIEMMPELSIDGELMTKLTLHPMLEKAGVKSFVSHQIKKINESSVTVLDMAANREFDIEFDTLINALGKRPLADLEAPLREKFDQCIVIGDALSRSNICSGIEGGFFAALKI